MNLISIKSAATAAMALALATSSAAAEGSASFDATLLIQGADLCADLSGLQSSGDGGSSVYEFTGVDPTTGVVTATGNSITVSLADSAGGTVMCNSPTDKKVILQSLNGALVPGSSITVDTANFADQVTYNVTSIEWGPDVAVTKVLPQPSSALLLSQTAYTKQGASVGNIEVGLELDATTLPLIATTYEDVLTITVTDGNTAF